MGKAPSGVAKLARRYGKKTIAICGAEGDGAKAVHDAGIIAYFPVLRKVTTLEEAMLPETTAENIRSTVEEVFRVVSAF
jgi:glycerate kinase